MTDTPAKPVLLTGASGALGRVLTKSLSALGWTLVLTDIAPFPDPVPAGCRFTRADLSNGVDILRLAEGCGAIIHLGGVSVERPFEEVHRPQHPRPLSHLRSRPAREGARDLRLVQPLDRLPRTDREHTGRHAVPARRLLRLVEGLWRADGPAVLVQARGRERVHPHRLRFAGADQRPHAGNLDVVSAICRR